MVGGERLSRVGCSGSSVGYISHINQVSAWSSNAGSKTMRCININHIWSPRPGNSFRKPWKGGLFSLEANNSVKCECLFNKSPGFLPFCPLPKEITASFCSLCFTSTAVRLHYLHLSPYSKTNDLRPGGSGLVEQLAEYLTLFHLCERNPHFCIPEKRIKIKIHLPLLISSQVSLAPSKCTLPTS